MTLGDDILPKPLTKKELHQLAMNIVGEELKKSGFEFLSVNSKLQKDPQFVCLKKKKYAQERSIRFDYKRNLNEYFNLFKISGY